MPQKPSAARIDEEAHLVEQIASAVTFTAHLRVGPHDKHTTRDIATAQAAFDEADRLTAEHSHFGRSALVYAITPRGYTVPVTRELAKLAGRL